MDEQIQREPDTLCRHCDSKVACFSKPEATYFTALIVCIVIMIFGIWSFCILPFAIPLSKAIVIRCARCNSKLETKQPFGLFSLKDEVLTIKLGDCVIVMTRTYLLVMTIVVSGLIFYWWYISIPPPKEIIYSNVTWEEYLKDCGMEVVLVNGVRASQKFKTLYEGKTIQWDGYLVRATQNPGGYIFRGDHAVVILVKMVPTESNIHADLILTMDDHDFGYNLNTLRSMQKGSHFRFNATFVSVGNENMLHHFHASHLEKLDGHMQIADHVHVVNQRYNVNNQPSNIKSLDSGQ